MRGVQNSWKLWIQFAWLNLALVGCQPERPEVRTRVARQRPAPAAATAPATPSEPAAAVKAAPLRDRYEKREHYIPMRDGVRLFTAVYSPKDTSRSYPILLNRTPYSISPYGEGEFPENLIGNESLEQAGYIFVKQDVRGRFQSEGVFENMRPHIARKSEPKDVDESSDTYDTIEWLLEHVANHNGKVGQSGISYPGFYSSAGMIDHHPALVAVSPQAPVADWYFDDFFHHGAFFLPHSFNFFTVFDDPRPVPTTQWGKGFEHGTPDGYAFFLRMGPLKNAQEKYLHGRSRFWNEATRHPNYDEFWQARNILPHLKNVSPAVMTVGGWYDAEDLYGTINTYQAIERQNPGIRNTIVMGPWAHGGWYRGDGDKLGNIHFGAKTAKHFQDQVEYHFFEHHLKGIGTLDQPEAYMFETGANRWRSFNHWPPKGLADKCLYFHSSGELSIADAAQPTSTVSEQAAFTEFVSDPARPVPFTQEIAKGMTKAYMTDDQRFAARRQDVLTWQTEELEADVTLAGPLLADLWVSTTGTDSDWIVKLIDVFPPDAEDYPDMADGEHLGEYQMMVRSEAFRGRFRNSYQQPEPFTPGEPANVKVPLQDVLHTFQKGHRIMVQVQSTWFPLVDRNPQTYVPNIFEADEADFIKATNRVHHGGDRASHLRAGVLTTFAE